jgi:diguanylate cyclase (GGDEF)-like protein
VLKRVASVLGDRLREQDIVTRWGGDEFVLLLPGMDQVGATSMARRISGTLLERNGHHGPISVSIGIAAFPSDGTTADELLAAADRSMYQAKRQAAA